MKTYLMTTEHSSRKRGYNRTVNVYRVKNNQPIYVGSDDEINTGSYKGDYATACEIISKADGHKMAADGYTLASKSIKIVAI